MDQRFHIIVVGGGAAGFFAALSAASHYPGSRIAILERGKEVLQKVKVSGGGRCNLTHACFDPQELIHFYPRGSKELLGPFHRFAPGDTLEWFESRGVATKIEEDGRIFPQSDQSQSIIDCLNKEARQNDISILRQQNVIGLYPPNQDSKVWTLKTAQGAYYQASMVMLASGSNPNTWKLLEQLGHTIIPPVPSLFTFNIQHPLLKGLAGLSVLNAHIQIPHTKLQASGPTLITHWGLSGPGILRLSAWGARILNEKKYTFPIEINWLGGLAREEIQDQLHSVKHSHARKQVHSPNPIEVPHRLWVKFIEEAHIDPTKRWADIKREELDHILSTLHCTRLQVTGKSTFKEEFVTAGGVSLKEIDFKHFSSKIYPSLFLAGEVLDIDAITGGFNFQAAWTGGWIAGGAMAEEMEII